MFDRIIFDPQIMGALPLKQFYESQRTVWLTLDQAEIILVRAGGKNHDRIGGTSTLP